MRSYQKREGRKEITLTSNRDMVQRLCSRHGEANKMDNLIRAMAKLA
jgi:hypothetical protein